MQFIKGLGLGIYYRLRRMNKALKNWRKFGVIIFGSIFLIGSVLAPLQAVGQAEAEGLKLTYLYIDPSTVSVGQGKTYQFQYRAEDQNHQTIAVTPNWSMANSAAGAITSAGLFTASQTPGTYVNAIKLSSGVLSTYARVIITQTSDNNTNNTGNQTSNTIVINNNTGTPSNSSPKLTYLYIDPSTLSLKQGQSSQMKYRAEDQNHQTMTITPNWSMSNATAGSISPTGLFTASQTLGTYNNAIKLSAGILSTYARVIVISSGNVTPPPTTSKLTYLYIDPSTVSLAQGQTYQFKYRAEDQNHQTMAITPNWSMANSTAGSISPTGLFTASNTLGTYTNAVKLSAGILSTYARVIVYKPATPAIQLNSVAISPTSTTLTVGNQKQFTATAYDQNGAVINSGVTFHWDVTNTQAGGITQTGLFTADNHLGTYSNVVKVTATYNSVSKSAYASVTVQAGVTPGTVLTSVVIDPTYTTLQTGNSQQFTATAYDQNGQVTSASFSWAVVNGGGTINQSGWFTANYQTGTYQNTVRVTATKNGISKLAYATVVVNEVVNQAVLDRVEVTPSSANILINQQYDFNAQAYDNYNNTITSGVTYYWSVISGPGSINQNGFFSANNLTGTATVQVRASQGGVDRYAIATVYISDNNDHDNNDLSYVRITPSTAYLSAGSSVDFDAQAYDYDGNTVSATYTWDLMSNIGTLNQNGYFTAYSGVTGTYSDAVRVRAYRDGVERYDYADIVISTYNNNNNYGLNATLTATDENGGTAREGDIVVYTLRLTNNQNDALTNVYASFDVPQYATFASVISSTGTNPSIYGRNIQWNVGTLYVNNAQTLTIRVMVNTGIPSNAVIRGKANIWASGINAFWVYANDIYVVGTGTADYDNGVPLTNTGALDWAVAGLASLIATVLTKKFLLHSLL